MATQRRTRKLGRRANSRQGLARKISLAGGPIDRVSQTNQGLNQRLDMFERRIAQALHEGRDYGPVYHDTETVTVTNTASSSTLTEFAPAGEMAPEDFLRVRCGGTYTNNTGSPQTLTVGVQIDTTNIWGDGVSIATNANERAWWMDFEIGNLSDQSSQYCMGMFTMGHAAAAGSAASGVIADTNAQPSFHAPFMSTTDPAKDWTKPQRVRIQISHGAANASLTIVKYVATWERGRTPRYLESFP